MAWQQGFADWLPKSLDLFAGMQDEESFRYGELFILQATREAGWQSKSLVFLAAMLRELWRFTSAVLLECAAIS